MEQTERTSWAPDTLFVHGRNHPRTGMKAQGNMTGVPTVQPIYASTTYLHENVEALDQAFEGSRSGEQTYVYGRQGNPSVNAFETIMAQAEGGVGAVAFGSGMA